MEILKKGEMPDGTRIQIENWKGTYSFMFYGSTIAAYPKDRYGITFLTSCDFGSNKEAEKVFNELIQGTKTLKDFNFDTFKDGKVVPYTTRL